MKKILITGATGNIGVEVVRFFFKNETKNTIIAGVRSVEKAKTLFGAYPNLEYVNFDFENPATFDSALTGIDIIFLLRPPHISDIEYFFRPLIEKVKEKGIKQIVFLSVQGAEKSSIIPHNKVEKLIREHELEYVFLRPSYFMQNLTTTLIDDIQQKRKIILPASNALFNWIDVENIGETTAMILENLEPFKNQAIELTGYENKSFYQVSDTINQLIDNPIQFKNVNPFRFYRIKKKEGMINGMIVVMILLHFLPRFQKPPKISSFYESMTGKKPTSMVDFIKREKQILNLQK
jgi:uncharacterized protein YbjT (DUF2867 family)